MELHGVSPVHRTAAETRQQQHCYWAVMKAKQKTFSLREVPRRVRFPSVTSNPCFDFLPFHATLSILKYPYNECTVGLRFVSQMMTFQAATDVKTRIRYPLLF